MIEVDHLRKHYEDVRAIKDISFNVRKGEVFGFLGPNGAGKTTTINMLIGLALPTAGSFRIAGWNGNKDMKKIQSIIGIVPDESNLYDEMSGFENLVFCASLYGIRKHEREKRARNLLEEFNLKETGERPFKAYSKGMKRKLTIAAGIIHRPEILFLDEPTSGIDVKSARQIRRMIKRLGENGTTIFLTTHYIEDAERLCDRIAFIAEGEIVEMDSMSALLDKAHEDNVIELRAHGLDHTLFKRLRQEFTDVNIWRTSGTTIRASSKERLSITPFLELFEQHDLHVDEAKIIRPSLEEVFVRLTGIEADRMTNEEGKA